MCELFIRGIFFMFFKYFILLKVVFMIIFNMYMVVVIKIKNLYFCNFRDIVGLRIVVIFFCVVIMIY